MRTKEHILETIATRTFEQVLAPQLVAIPRLQGTDYGVDYHVEVYGGTGRVVRGFDVQVKHLPSAPESAPTVTDLMYPQQIFRSSDLCQVVPFCIKVSHLRRWLDADVAQGPTLLFTGNQHDVMFVWITDLWDYYLKWHSHLLENSKTVTIYLNSVRCLPPPRPLNVSSGKSRHVPDQQEDANPRVCLCEASTKDSPLIGEWARPGSIDSLMNVAISIYCQHSSRARHIHADFNTEGCWNHLASASVANEWLFVVFARFIGTLTPTPDMLLWARQTLSSWDRWAHVPAALRVVSTRHHCDSSRIIIDEISESLLDGRSYARWSTLKADLDDTEWHYAYEEFLAALADLLQAGVKVYRSAVAEQALVECFAQHAYSVCPINVFARALATLWRSNSFTLSATPKALAKLCQVDERAFSDRGAALLRRTASRWYDEYRDGK